MTIDFDPYYKWLGIPPKDQPPHRYRLLGIELFETDREVIDAAANRLMGYLKDLAVGDEGTHSQHLLNEIARARLCLLKEKTKVAYDDQLRKELKSAGVLEREARKPSVKGPPPRVQKRSVPPPAVPPTGAVPPATAEPPNLPKPPSSPAPRFDPAKIAPLDNPPQKPRAADPVKIVVGADADKSEEPAAVKDAPVQPRLKASKAEKQQRDDSNSDNDVPAQPPRKGRGVLIAFVLISIVGLIGLALIIVMSVLLLTS